MKTQHVLAAVAMVGLVGPIMLGLGSFFVIPLVLVGVAVLPLVIVGGLFVLATGWHHVLDSDPDGPRPHRHPRLPMSLAPRT
jgi:hypothetical protein